MGVAITLYHLGVCIRDAGRLQEAEGLFRCSLTIEESTPGGDGIEVASAL